MRLVIAELKNCCWFALIQKGIHLTLIGIFYTAGMLTVHLIPECCVP